MTINISPTWNRVIKWLGQLLPSQAPAKETIELGMKEFENAVKLNNCAFDTRMVRALRLKDFDSKGR